MPIRPAPLATGQPRNESGDVTYDAAVKRLGYLFVHDFGTEDRVSGTRDEHVKLFDVLTVDPPSDTLTESRRRIGLL